MATERPPRDRNRRIVAATCTCRGVCSGFTNVAVTKRGGEIEIDPHVTGQCVLQFDEAAATALRDALTELLG